MESATIANLPEEVLIEVFSLLDRRSLLSSALQCKRWHQIISNSTVTMKNFTLTIKEPSAWLGHLQESWKKSFEIERKLVNVKFESLEHKEADILKVVQKHEFSLRSLELVMCDLNAQMFMKVLATTANLEKVSISHSSFDWMDSVEATSLKRLKFVKVYGCELKALKLFSASQIKCLEVNFSDKDSVGHLMDFFSTQNKLESAKIESQRLKLSEIFKNLTRIEPGFQPKKLAICCSDNDESIPRSASENFTTFLQLHGKNLQELEISNKMSPEMLKFILTRLEALKKITISAIDIPTDPEFQQNFQVSTNIKELILTGKFSDLNSAKLFLKRFPQLESLSLDMVCEFTLRFIEANMKQLKRLGMKRLTFSFSSLYLKFPELKELQIGELRSFPNFEMLLESNPSIEKLTIDEIYLNDVSNYLVETITSTPSLKHVQVQGEVLAMSEFQKRVKAVERNFLESMKLIVKDDSEKKNKTFYFCFQ